MAISSSASDAEHLAVFRRRTTAVRFRLDVFFADDPRDTVHPNVVRVRDALIARACNAEPIVLPLSARTAPEAAAAVGTSVAQIVKSLVFIAGDEPVLVIASGANRVSIEKLAAIAGDPVTRADAATVKRATGFSIGGVPPVGHATSLRIVIDRDLLTYDEVWAAAGMPDAVFSIAPAELVRITGGEVADVRDG